MFKKKLILPLLIALTVIFSSMLGAATYAFWTRTITVSDNTIKTGNMALEVNGADGTQAGRQLSIDNLYPSYIHYVEEQINIKNAGSLDIKYKLEFINVDLDNQLIYDNVLVSFDNGTTWVEIADSIYLNLDFTKGSEDNLTILFRLNPLLEDESTMDQTVEFTILVTAIQSEDDF